MSDVCEYAELGEPVCPAAAERDALRARLAEAEALLRSAPIDRGDAYSDDWERICNAFLAADSATHRENERG